MSAADADPSAAPQAKQKRLRSGISAEHDWHLAIETHSITGATRLVVVTQDTIELGSESHPVIQACTGCFRRDGDSARIHALEALLGGSSTNRRIDFVPDKSIAAGCRNRSTFPEYGTLTSWFPSLVTCRAGAFIHQYRHASRCDGSEDLLSA